MPDMYVDSGGAVIVPLNLMPLIDDTDFKSIEPALVYNSAGLVLTWNFQTTAGVMTSTAITATTSGVHDISEPLANVGMYGIEIPASGGNWANDGNAARVGVGWFTGVATGILPWRGPTIGFRAAVINNREIDGAGTGTELTAIPWNAAWDAEVQSECDDAITANAVVLDIPTTTEFNARTMPTADYVVVGDTIAGVTTVTTCTTNTDMVAEAPSADTIATAVWAEAVPGSYTAGQAGHLIGNMPTLASAVDAMWDEGTGGHVTPTTTGKALIDAGAAGTPPTVGEIRTEMDSNSTQLAAIVADTNELQTNQGAWATATGFATAANVTTAHATTDGLINALNDFDPANDAVASVTLVGTCTANTDMVTEPPTALAIADQVWDEVATDHVTASTFGKLMLAFKTLLGHKSSENEAGSTVTYRTASDAADAGTMTWDETNKTRGEYSGF